MVDVFAFLGALSAFVKWAVAADNVSAFIHVPSIFPTKARFSVHRENIGIFKFANDVELSVPALDAAKLLVRDVDSQRNGVRAISRNPEARGQCQLTSWKLR